MHIENSMGKGTTNNILNMDVIRQEDYIKVNLSLDEMSKILRH